MLRTQLKIDSGYYYCEAQNWSKDKPDAFAGVHSQVGLLLTIEPSNSQVPKKHSCQYHALSKLPYTTQLTHPRFYRRLCWLVCNL
jgi:hypothetical protein